MAHIKSMDDLRNKQESDDDHDENDYYAGGKSGQIIRGPPVSSTCSRGSPMSICHRSVLMMRLSSCLLLCTREKTRNQKTRPCARACSHLAVSTHKRITPLLLNPPSRMRTRMRMGTR